jgi:hypothetical protein
VLIVLDCKPKGLKRGSHFSLRCDSIASTLTTPRES